MAENDGPLQIDSVPQLADLIAHFEEHKPKLRRMLAHRIDPVLAARIDADGLLSDTFLLARRRWHGFAASGMTAYAWLYRLALDCLIEAWRTHTRGKCDVHRDIPWPEGSSIVLGGVVIDSAATPGAAAAREELRRMVGEALDQLDDSDRRVLWMHHFDDLNYREIGEVLDITQAAATKRYARALERLRAVWRQQHPADTSGILS